MRSFYNSPLAPASGRLRLQRGISLVELMVGIVIGLLVVMVAMGTLVTTNSSSSIISDTVRLEQQANMTMEVIGRQIRQTGAVSTSTIPGAANTVSYTPFAGLNGAKDDTPRITVQGEDGANGAPDTLIITYSAPQLDPALNINEGGMRQNCSGNNPVVYPPMPTDPKATPPASQTAQVVSALTVANGNLRCAVPGDVATISPLADNVRDFQVRYLTNNGITTSSRTATQVGTDWTSVSGIEVCLHIVGDTTQAPVAPTVRGCLGETIAADGRLHRVVRSVFRLRNSA